MQHAIEAIEEVLERLGEMGMPDPSHALSALAKVLAKLMGMDAG